jgi:hypothetical protein
MSAASSNPFVTVIEAAGVDSRVREKPAIVLERIARGGGATRWYWVRTAGDLERLYGRLTPGRVVSFYFDDRIKRRILNDDTDIEILDLVANKGDAVVGRLSRDGLEILVDFVAGPSELSELRSHLEVGEPVFFGAFPGRDTDGTSAITLTLPDADGVVRAHPH